MGTTVDLDALEATVTGYGFAYLITIGENERIHTSPVNPVVAKELLSIPDISARVRMNAERQPRVSLVWPPVEDGGYSLIVDGTASGEGDTLRVTPARAVLHRPELRETDPSSGSTCRSDCVEI